MMGSSKRLLHSTNTFSSDSMVYGDGVRFKFNKNSHTCTTLIILLFRFEYIGGLLVFPNSSKTNHPNLIHYFVVAAILILPTLYMLLFIGHYSKLGCLVIARIVPVTHGVGYTMIVITAIQAVYEIVVACDSLIYFQLTFSSSIPWMECQPSYGADCIGLKEMNACSQSESNSSKCFTRIEQLSAYKYRVHVLRELKPSDNEKSRENIERFWQQVEGQRVIFLFVCIFAVLMFSDLNVSSDNKTATVVFFLYILGMIIFGFICLINVKSSEGISDVFSYQIYNIYNLFSSYNWYETIAFFVKAISLANVCTVLIGSYMPMTAMADLQAFIVWIGIVTLYLLGEVLVCLLRSALAARLNVKPHNIYASGIDSILILFPQYFGSLSFTPQTVNFCFFFLLLCTSLFRVKLLLATMYHTLADGKPVIRAYKFYIRVFSCAFLMILAFPICVVGFFREFITLLRILEDILSAVVLVIVTIGILYVYGTQTLCDDHHFTYGSQPAIFFKITLLAVPAIQIGFGAYSFIVISNLYVVEPLVAYYVYGTFPICLCLQLVGLLYVTIYYLKRQNMAHLLRCEESWGDPNQNTRKERIIYHPRKETNYFRRIDVCKHDCLRYNRIHVAVCREEETLHHEGFRMIRREDRMFQEEEVNLRRDSDDY